MVATVLAHGAPPTEVTPHGLLTGASIDPLPAALVLLAAALYLYGVRRLHRRGDSWHAGRTVAFVGLGLGSVAVATLSGLAAYDDTVFSVHMVQHMLLTMVAPVFLALGAPITLALRTVGPRSRRTLLTVLHSRAARVVTFPLVGWLLFVASPFALYFSGWYDATLDNDLLHQLLHVHFLVVGCIFFWPLLGLDPLPGRLPHPLRLLVIFTTLPFHAFL